MEQGTAQGRFGRLGMALAAAAAAVLLACSLAGCAGGGEQQGAQQAGAQNSVTDAYGRTVELPEEVNTAATVGSAARFVVYAGAQDKLVAVTEMDTPASPARPYTEVWADTFAALPTTSNGNHLMETSVDAEKLLELKPDVVISSRSAEECDQLQEQTGIPVVGISYQDQLFSDDVYTSIQVVGDTLGTSEHAAGVVDKLKEWDADLDGRTKDIADADKPSCYAGAVNYKGAKSFDGSYAHYAPFEAVNVKNVTDETGQTGSVQVSLEQLGEWNPDIMFLNAGNMDLMSQDYASNQAFFDSLTAFQTGALYTQPSYNMNGTNVEMGICDAYFIGATVYPEQFADVDLPAKYDEIFSTMLGEDYYATMQSLGMDFKQLSFS